MHRAISQGVFRWMGPIGKPAKRANDVVTDRVYAIVRTSLHHAATVAVAVAGRPNGDMDAPPSTSGRAQAIAHGVVSDELLAAAPELDMEVTLRRQGVEVVPDRSALAAAYPQATGRVVVFVHGLVDTEMVWSGGPPSGTGLPGIVAELGGTPVLVRYGTGRSVGRNGTDLGRLIERIVATWPVEVTDLLLVGHSMGGLVIRSAMDAFPGDDWTALVNDVVYLGTPHTGSWLEKVANVGSWSLRHSSVYTAPLGALLDNRSRGIKDLRFGMLRDDGWNGTVIDALLSGLVPNDPWPVGVHHHLVVGRLRPSDRHPLTLAFGDALVRRRSAAGLGRDAQAMASVEVVPVDARHRRLTHAPEVVALLRRILGNGRRA